METNLEVWDGRIRANKKRLELVWFRLEPSYIHKLNKIENKSEFMRSAIKERLDHSKFPARKLMN